jgi:hypothetical protein
VGRKLQIQKWRSPTSARRRSTTNTPRDCITVNFGHDIGKNIDKRKVVNGNGQGNPHNVNQLTGGGNANDGEEDVAKNNVVQEFIVLHLLAR